MEQNKEFDQAKVNMAQALLQFKYAYRELFKSAAALDEYDFTERYPFYLLDFIEIAPAVFQWCDLHSKRLLHGIPDMVDNPACLRCPDLRIGAMPDGTCKAALKNSCFNLPTIPYARDNIIAALRGLGYAATQQSDTEIQLFYNRLVGELHDRNRDAGTSQETVQ